MREDFFKVLKFFENKVKSQSIDFDPTLTFYRIREEKGEIIFFG